MVVGEVVPGVAILAVVFTNRTPLSFAEIGTPLLPWNVAFTCFIKASLLVSLGIVRTLARFHGRLPSLGTEGKQIVTLKQPASICFPTLVSSPPACRYWNPLASEELMPLGAPPSMKVVRSESKSFAFSKCSGETCDLRCGQKLIQFLQDSKNSCWKCESVPATSGTRSFHQTNLLSPTCQQW